LQEEEIQHLRQRERDHRKINTAAANGKKAEHQAQHPSCGRAEQQAQAGRPAPRGQRVPAGIGRQPQEGRMAERQQAHVAQQQVEGARKQRVAQHLHDENGVGPQGGQQPDEKARHDIKQHFALHVSFPNKPDGRSSRTITMIMNTTVFAAGGQNTLVRPSMTPRPRPVTIDPMIEPMPPITTTANTTMMRLEPMSGDSCSTGAASTPAKPASATPKPKVREISTGTFTPKASTSLGFSVAARNRAPSRVFSMMNQVARHTTTDAATTQAR